MGKQQLGRHKNMLCEAVRTSLKAGTASSSSSSLTSLGDCAGEEFEFDELFTGQSPPGSPKASRFRPAGDMPDGHLEEQLLEVEQQCSYKEHSSVLYPERITRNAHSLLGPTPAPAAFSLEQLRSLKDPQPEDDSDDGRDVEVSAVIAGVDREVPAGSKMGPGDFELLRVVGKGAFGKVFQVVKKDDGQVLAMKVMRKDQILARNHTGYMRAERDILTSVEHPYIVAMRYSFQTPSKLYLLLDFINGGHLFFQLYKQGIFNEELTRLYTAEIVLAVAHLHSLDIIHRDLKPENILLDTEGHVRITDFGLAKAEVTEMSATNSLCGTMEYMSPEIILAKGHGKPADWWSLGILMCEMLTGKPPFYHKNRQKLQDQIAKQKLKLPSYLSPAAHNILKSLLNKDPAKRLGSGPTGAAEIMSHPFFKPINWKLLGARKIPSPFKPDIDGDRCTANFDETWTKMPVADSPSEAPAGFTDPLADPFFGYTYIRPNVLDTVLAS
eukprot:jgi/Chlat1/3635/Chrsp238S03626